MPKSEPERQRSNPEPGLRLEEFAGELPTRSLEAWHRLFTEDASFPVESHRPFLGPLLVAFRRLLRPLVRIPQNDLWERQRVFNLIAIERLRAAEALETRVDDIDQRLRSLEASYKDGLDEVVRAGDALFSRVDIKLEAYRAELDRFVEAARHVGAVADAEPDQPSLAQAFDEAEYVAFEDRQRGSRDVVLSRLDHYANDLVRGPVLDLGCGRGEVLEFLTQRGVEARGVDQSAAMVRECGKRGLQAEQGDLNDALSAVPDGSLGAVTCFHVIEHLQASQRKRLLEEAFRVLAKGGLLLLETPNPESIRVGASTFWIDPTHLRPVHPDGLRAELEAAGFRDIEMRACQQFSEQQRLPEIDLEGLDPAQRDLADRVNRLRDRLDELLHGHRDYAALARIS